MRPRTVPEGLRPDPTLLPAAVGVVPRVAWRNGRFEPGTRVLPEETPVALVFDGATEAVMMATPADLEDFAVGFALTEGLILHPEEVRGLEIVQQADGMEARLWLAPGRAAERALRRRRLTGPTGCGLCGIESLAEAARAARPVGDGGLRLSPESLREAMAALSDRQPLNQAVHAVHAAGFWKPGAGLGAVREDVGRHNALDKLAGALARDGIDASGGAVLLTSRVSVEMVQKSAAIGAPVIVAVSAPTALALRTAESAGITVAAIARSDGFEVFTRPERIAL